MRSSAWMDHESSLKVQILEQGLFVHRARAVCTKKNMYGTLSHASLFVDGRRSMRFAGLLSPSSSLRALPLTVHLPQMPSTLNLKC